MSSSSFIPAALASLAMVRSLARSGQLAGAQNGNSVGTPKYPLTGLTHSRSRT